jgi:hypothetical protein
MRHRAPRAADMMFMSWLVIAILVRFLVNCLLASRQLARGEPGVGQAISEFSMLHFLVIVFLLPLLSSTLSLGAAGLDRKRLTITGLPLGSQALVELAGIFTHPVTWIALLFVVPAAIPLWSIRVPGASIVSLFAVSIAALLAAHALGNVLSTSRAAHRISGAFRFIFTGALLGILFSNADFQWTSGTVRIFLFQHPTLLVDDAGRGLLTLFQPWSPSVWIFRGWVIPCAALAVAALGLYVLSLRGMYDAAGEPAPARPRRAVEHARGSGMSAVVYRHELRYLGRSLGGLVAIAAGIASFVWLLATRDPSVNIALLGGFLALAAGFSYPSNAFGHDGHALRRYALLGPDWGKLFAAKNRAWLTVMGVSVLLLVSASAVRVSLSSGVSLLLSAGTVLAFSVVWGNISSVLLPSRIGSGQAQAFVNQAAPFALCSLPLAIHSTVAPFGSPGFDVAVCICLAAATALYALLLRRISRAFDSDVESVLARF